MGELNLEEEALGFPTRDSLAGTSPQRVVKTAFGSGSKTGRGTTEEVSAVAATVKRGPNVMKRWAPALSRILEHSGGLQLTNRPTCKQFATFLQGQKTNNSLVCDRSR